ncbi:MAG: TRAP transporter substrate-binding protein [Deltaproteobacteria bacterium]|nr:TRAP transporter substrate-binding protein [Deltaproteobacteria bacterium]
MKKRTILAALGMAILGALSMGGAAQANPIDLKVSTFLPPNHTFVTAMKQWDELLQKESKGQLKLTLYPAGQLAPPPRQFDLAKSGAADIVISLHGLTPGRFPMADLAGLPLTHPKAGSRSAISSRRLTELAPEFLGGENEGVRVLWMAVTPPLMFHTSKKAIRKLEDFRGLRIRYAGKVFGELITALGASPLAVQPGETADAMSKGIIDGATFPYEATKSFGLGNIAKYTLEPGVASATFGVVMNLARYESLPKDLKALVDRTTGPDAAENFGKMWDSEENVGKQYLIEKGVEITTMPDSEIAGMRNHFKPIIDSALAALEKEGKPGRKFFEAYTK